MWAMVKGGNADARATELPSEMNLPRDHALASGRSNVMAISPDGQQLVYVAALGSGATQLFAWTLDQFAPVEIEATAGGNASFFSPDGAWIGFTAGGALKKVRLRGGFAETITTIPFVSSGATWGDDDVIVIGALGGGLFQVPAGGGELERLTVPNVGRREAAHGGPQLLPGGRGLLFTIQRSGGSRLAVRSPGASDWRTIEELGPARTGRYVRSGHLVYSADDGALWGVRFDPRELVTLGRPRVLGVNTHIDAFGLIETARFAVSDRGPIVFVTGEAADTMRRPVAVSRAGEVEPLNVRPGAHLYPHLAPDGRRFAAQENAGLLVHDLTTGMARTVAHEGNYPVWTPDGARIVFSLPGEYGSMDLFWTAADGGSEPELLLQREYSQFPHSWSPDGKALAFYDIRGDRGRDIWLLPIDGNRAPVEYIATAANETSPTFSPDGRWIAYVSDQHGRDEIWVGSYPGVGTPYTVAHGSEPVWAPNGRELFFRRGTQLLVVEVNPMRPTFEVSTPRALFSGPFRTPAAQIGDR